MSRSATSARKSTRGRPDVTTHAAIEQAAFELFAERGFAGTTLEAIAAQVGVGRRTLFRYYQSKNDIPWGQFDRTLDHFRGLLAEQSDDLPAWQAIHRGVVEFNKFPSDATPSHRARMELILSTPELQAHSVHRYEEWRQVIVEEAARRTGLPADALLPRTVGHVCLALSLSAYEQWMGRPELDGSGLVEIIDQAMAGLRTYLEASSPAAG